MSCVRNLSVVREGWDGVSCYVHARIAAHGDDLLLTAQRLNTAGDDDFSGLEAAVSRDGGADWSDFAPVAGFAPCEREGGIRTVASDMTPLWHRASRRFLVTGHTVDYDAGSDRPVSPFQRTRVIPYASYDPATGVWSPVRTVAMPAGNVYADCGSGCSQCCELPDGDLLMPVSYWEKADGEAKNAVTQVLRCSYDGVTLKVRAFGNPLAVEDEVRGLGEASVIGCGGRFFLTLRGDTHGYVSVSGDGLRYTQPVPWCWDDGGILPTYNTQSHFLTLGRRLYLVYTRKNGHNDHVFRHRAPLYMAEVDPERLCVIRSGEIEVIPERGARLGNFGVTNDGPDLAYISASEWMQPKTCTAYGSNNALWLCTLRESRI